MSCQLLLYPSYSQSTKRANYEPDKTMWPLHMYCVAVPNVARKANNPNTFYKLAWQEIKRQCIGYFLGWASFSILFIALWMSRFHHLWWNKRSARPFALWQALMGLCWSWTPFVKVHLSLCAWPGWYLFTIDMQWEEGNSTCWGLQESIAENNKWSARVNIAILGEKSHISVYFKTVHIIGQIAILT